MYTAEHFISKLGLEKHIEGGYFKEVYRNQHLLSGQIYSEGFEDKRALATTIYFLLQSGQVSRFHSLKFDEIWFYHYGCPMLLHSIDSSGSYSAAVLGLGLDRGEMPQVLVPAHTIFGAEPLDRDSFSLVSCMVTPGFDFRDFVLYTEEELLSRYPQHADIISRLNG